MAPSVDPPWPFSLLPAGDWTRIAPHTAGGMMEQHGGAFHATAYSVPKGRSVYLKMLVARGESAGSDTAAIAGQGRPRILYSRLQEIQRLKDIPVVDLVDLVFIDEPEALAIAMSEVTPLRDVIESGKHGPELSVAVLRTLRAEACGDWLHYDICPRNVAVSEDGVPVFIDLDSLYKTDDREALAVSVAACKPHRIPPSLERRCRQAAAPSNLPYELVAEKHNAEVVLLAAECSLGFFPGYRDLDEWVEEGDERVAGGLVSFWRRELEALRGGCPRPLLAVARELEALTAAGQVNAAPAIHEKFNDAFVSEDGSLASTKDALALSFGEESKLLRQDSLGRRRLADYLSALRAKVREEPNLGLWYEIILIHLSYRRDPAAALVSIRRALEDFPGDSRLLDNLQLARIWCDAVSA